MPSTYTTRNRLVKPAPGELNDSWGSTLNSGMFDMTDAAMDGMVSFALSTTKTLTTADGATDEARCRYINIISGSGGTVTIPNLEKVYIVRNGTTGTVTFTTGSGTTCSVPTASSAVVACEGGNVCRSFLLVDSGAWTSFTPTLGASSGTLTTASATGSYRRTGRTIHFQIQITITTNGTAAGHITATLPAAASNSHYQTVSSTVFPQGAVGTIASGASVVTVHKYDGTYPGADGAFIVVGGSYQIA